VSAFALGVLLTASVGVHVSEERGVSQQDREALVALLVKGVEKRSGQKAVIDKKTGRCEPSSECASKVRARANAEEAILLRLIGGPFRILVVAERHSNEMHRAQAELNRRAKPWGDQIERLVEELYPVAEPEPARDPPPVASTATVALALPPPQVQPEVLLPPPEPPSSEPSLTPWIVIGAGVALGAVAIAFGIENLSVRNEAETPGLTNDRLDELDDRAFRSGLAADILYGASGLGIAAGVLLLLVD
jgi:hypothetical protein